MIKKNFGFTLVEMLMVVAIVNVLAVVSLTRYKSAIDTSLSKQCLFNRSTVERVNQYYIADKEAGSPSINALVQGKYLESAPTCSAKGTYVWVPSTMNVLGRQYVICSIHGYTQ